MSANSTGAPRQQVAAGVRATRQAAISVHDRSFGDAMLRNLSMAHQLIFTSEQICQRSKENATGLVLGSIALLKERGWSAEEWFASMRQRFGVGWDALKAEGALAAMSILALNTLSVGATVVSLTGDAAQAELVITDWPPQEFLDILGLSVDDTDGFWEGLWPMPTYLGYAFTWRRTGPYVSLTFASLENQ